MALDGKRGAQTRYTRLTRGDEITGGRVESRWGNEGESASGIKPRGRGSRRRQEILLSVESSPLLLPVTGVIFLSKIQSSREIFSSFSSLNGSVTLSNIESKRQVFENFENEIIAIFHETIVDPVHFSLFRILFNSNSKE